MHLAYATAPADWSDIQNVTISMKHGGARGVMVIVVQNGHGDASSNPGPS